MSVKVKLEEAINLLIKKVLFRRVTDKNKTSKADT
jgi:hypothetical protein